VMMQGLSPRSEVRRKHGTNVRVDGQVSDEWATYREFGQSGSDMGQEEAAYSEGSQDIRARAFFAATSIFNAAAIRSR
jgi:hypothetical protein